ncbi:MAG TPA: nickel pincer cofactor biosynthesis protein LarC [Candidatus Dormibacteraeota bacterium]|nr:nickel pincer cofactor biosynthesis protein LarC [Candidatus Dormibacteraeota bacterium]
MTTIRSAYFDCFSGISGDMVLGALVDAGADLRAIEAELRRLGLEGWKISASKVQRGPIFATHVKVETEEQHHHRGLSIILKRINDAKLAPRAAERARNIFTRLAEAEAHVHQVPIEQVHFHEVGAVDSIVDIVGAAIGFEMLGIDEFACSPLDVGAGQVKTAHGLLPVPAPATAELLRGAPTFSSGLRRELVTPTGAAIATTLSSRYAEMPAMTLLAIGYGAGSADNAEKPNVLRLLIGERATTAAGELDQPEPRGYWDAPVTAIETNLDDMSPQIYGYFAEKALEAGALDVFSTPAQMKKNRPGLLITILSEQANVTKLIDLVFRETTTIGVRTYDVRRKTLTREFVPVATPYGEVRMKISRLDGAVLNATPEYDDCRKLAVERGVPLKQVIAAASFEYQKKSAPVAQARSASSAPK